MTVTAIITQVKNNLNRTDITDAQIYIWLNNRQRRILQLENVYFMEKTSTTSTVASQQTYTVPTDYKDELIITLVDSDSKRSVLTKWKGSEPEKGYTDTTKTGKPTNYWLWQDAYYLYPIPDAVYTLSLRYYYYLTDLSASNTTNELTNKFPDLLIAGATADGFTYLMETAMANDWENKYRIAYTGDKTTEGYLPYCRKRTLSNYDSRIRLRLR